MYATCICNNYAAVIYDFLHGYNVVANFKPIIVESDPQHQVYPVF